MRARLLLALAVGAPWACHSLERQRDRAEQTTSSAAPGLPRGATAPSAAPSSAPPAAPSSAEGAGWEEVRIADEGPLCVFAGHDERNAVLFAAEAQKQTLRAGVSVVFGTFPPTCLNEACNTGPNYQCEVDRNEPHTLVVHSRLSYRRKPGSVCAEDCRPVIAGCETEALEAGKYTVKYGTREFALRVPSVLPKPCEWGSSTDRSNN